MPKTRKQPTNRANIVPKSLKNQGDANSFLRLSWCVVVHYEFLPPVRTVNKEYYLGVMRHLREAIRQKRPDLWTKNSWFLHHDNAPAHGLI